MNAEIKLTLPSQYLAVLGLFAAKKDIRFYLQGICLEVGPEDIYMAATNGYILGCFHIKNRQPEITDRLDDIILPNDLLKRIRADGPVEVSIGAPLQENAGDFCYARPITLSSTDTSVRGKTVDGRFPDWRRSIPAQVTHELAQFNIAHLGVLAKAWGILHGRGSHPYVGIGHNGQESALISLGHADFTGAIMPIRSERVEVPNGPPDWLTGNVGTGPNVPAS